MSLVVTEPTPHVIFRVGDNAYALPVRDVVEVLRMVALTPLPEAPPWVAGILNLRGQGLAVVDTRHRLGLSPFQPSPNLVIMVVHVGERDWGMIVGDVLEVIDLSAEHLQRIDHHAGIASLVQHVAQVQGRTVMVLDLARLLGSVALRTS